MEQEQSTPRTEERKRGTHLRLDERGAIEALRKEVMSLQVIGTRPGWRPRNRVNRAEARHAAQKRLPWTCAPMHCRRRRPRSPEKPRPHKEPGGRGIIGRHGRDEARGADSSGEKHTPIPGHPYRRADIGGSHGPLEELREEYGKACFGQVFRTLAVDDGVDFASLPETEARGTMVYYAHPYRFGERGGTNGATGCSGAASPKELLSASTLQTMFSSSPMRSTLTPGRD